MSLKQRLLKKQKDGHEETIKLLTGMINHINTVFHNKDFFNNIQVIMKLVGADALIDENGESYLLQTLLNMFLNAPVDH